MPSLLKGLSEPLNWLVQLLGSHDRCSWGLIHSEWLRLLVLLILSTLLRICGRWVSWERWVGRQIEEEVFAQLNFLLSVVRTTAALNHGLVHLVFSTAWGGEEGFYTLTVRLTSLPSSLLPGHCRIILISIATSTTSMSALALWATTEVALGAASIVRSSCCTIAVEKRV